MNEKLYVQYGSGDQAVPGWLSYDSSLTLVIQRIPIFGWLMKSRLNCVFDDKIKYGDIVRGLPLDKESIDGIFCSHILEHLSYDDCLIAIENTYEYLKLGGVFRVIVPDLLFHIEEYQAASMSKDQKDRIGAAYELCRMSNFGVLHSRSSLVRRLMDAFNDNKHLWMWDYESLINVLSDVGFVDIKRFEQGVSDDAMFLRPERDYQFRDDVSRALALECRKPGN